MDHSKMIAQVISGVIQKVITNEHGRPPKGHSLGVPAALRHWLAALPTKERKLIGPFLGATNRKGEMLPLGPEHADQVAKIEAARDPDDRYPSVEELLEWTHEEYRDWYDMARVIKVHFEAALAQNRKLKGHLVELLEPSAVRQAWTGELYCACGCDKRAPHCLDADKGSNYTVERLSDYLYEFPALATAEKPCEKACLLCTHKVPRLDTQAPQSWAAAAAAAPQHDAEVQPVEYKWRVYWNKCGPIPTYERLEVYLCRPCACVADVSLSREYYYGNPELLELLLSCAKGDEFDRLFSDQKCLELTAPDKAAAEAEFVREFRESYRRQCTRMSMPRFD